MTDQTRQNAQEAELAALIVTALNLEVQASEIDPEAPLYDEGLGLDSIDMLEIALSVSKEFGVKLRADDKNNQQIFSSLRALSRYIQEKRAN
jgi:acyl carrier protein